MKMPQLRFTVRFLIVLVGLSALVLLIERQRRGRGQFVVARTFRGPAAESYAIALASELGKEHDLPAFSFVGSSEARDLVRAGRPLPVFSVAIGVYRTMDEARSVKNRVSKIKPRCLSATTVLWANRLVPAITTKERLR